MSDEFEYNKLCICTNLRGGDILPSCGKVGSKELADALEQGLKDMKLPYEFQRLHCMGKCHLGPTMRLSPGGPFIMGAKLSDVAHILNLLKDGNFDQLAQEFPLKESA
ncbi:hypothetical protein [Curvivirga sp.]|uniref:hypothetical protein n=1 Tax=Curvivirga sp. TaxID=2856848 RepID=UPI003B5922B6